ncbi:hypothetical protein B5F33_09170 [Collinsella sp. An2]|nr:hypothetical protein B5F33_09170 [Collinsella sp. An2]
MPDRKHSTGGRNAIANDTRAAQRHEDRHQRGSGRRLRGWGQRRRSREQCLPNDGRTGPRGSSTAPAASKRPTRGLSLWAIATWLVLWQLAALALDSELLLPGPLSVLSRLAMAALQPSFWGRLGFSLIRVVAGFAGGMAIASLGASLAVRRPHIEAFLAPPIALAKSVPVAAITVLALVWLRASELSVLVVMLVVTPLVYEALLAGLRARDPHLDELARVFHLARWRRARYITLPQLMPAIRSACTTGLGMAWKACVAAEVIGIPLGSVGEAFYDAKVHFDTPGLFAWTVAVVVASVAMEKLLVVALDVLHRAALSDFTVERISAVGAPSVPGSSCPASDRAPSALRLDEVSRHFVGGAGVGPISLDVRPGAPIAVMAPSGAGKSTLLRIAAGLEVPGAGTVARPGSGRASTVFQDDRLIEGASALTNARLAVPAGSREWQEAPDLLRHLGLEDCMARPVETCSGGQRRRIALARALLAPHDVLLLDEPFTGLDDESRAAAAALVRTREEGRCVLVATHDLRDADLLGAQVVYLS